MDTKTILGGSSVAIAIYSYVPYLAGIYRGKTKPHAFSWFIWAIVTSVICAGQLVAGAGPGAWVTAVTGTAGLCITILALKSGEKDIKPSDWIAFVGALATIPVWIMTKEPRWSVVLATLIDQLAFYPTFRKSWHKPEEEVAATYVLGVAEFALAILALDHLTLTTAIFPGASMISNFLLSLLLFLRRRRVHLNKQCR